jgi:hypothetical protein
MGLVAGSFFSSLSTSKPLALGSLRSRSTSLGGIQSGNDVSQDDDGLRPNGAGLARSVLQFVELNYRQQEAAPAQLKATYATTHAITNLDLTIIA